MRLAVAQTPVEKPSANVSVKIVQRSKINIEIEYKMWKQKFEIIIKYVNTWWNDKIVALEKTT